MATKKISTTVQTGDTFIHNGRQVRVGLYKKGVINLHYKINETSGYTEQVSTRKLNQILKQVAAISRNVERE